MTVAESYEAMIGVAEASACLAVPPWMRGNEDLLQDVRMATWRAARSLGRGPKRDDVKAYAHVVGRHAAISHMKGRRLLGYRGKVARQGVVPKVEPWGLLVLDVPAPTPVQAHDDFADTIQPAGLSPGQAKALTLAFVDGLGNAEIAFRMGESVANVKNLRYRAIQALRRTIA
jgi:DNA-directed RNA polymerase specialized sigma24 family protein